MFHPSILFCSKTCACPWESLDDPGHDTLAAGSSELLPWLLLRDALDSEAHQFSSFPGVNSGRPLYRLGHALTPSWPHLSDAFAEASRRRTPRSSSHMDSTCSEILARRLYSAGASILSFFFLVISSSDHKVIRMDDDAGVARRLPKTCTGCVGSGRLCERLLHGSSTSISHPSGGRSFVS